MPCSPRSLPAILSLIFLFGFPAAFAQVGEHNFYGWVRHAEGDQLGDVAPFTGVGGTGLLLARNGVWTFNGELLVSNDGDAGGSLGAGRRFWVGDQTIFGAALTIEANRSPFENSFQQSVLSAELFHGRWSFRFNGYLPFGDRVQSAVAPALTDPSLIGFVGNTLVTTSDIAQVDEVSMDGLDLEAAIDLGSPRAEVFLGLYTLAGDIGGDTDGFKAGARVRITPRWSANVTVSDDELFGTNVFGGASFFFGKTGAVPQTLEDKLKIPIERSAQVAINPVNTIVSAQTALSDGGNPISVTHVSNGGVGGTGTFEDPYNTLSAADLSTDDIIYIGSGSVFNNEDFRLEPDQWLLGEGEGAVHQIMTDQLGLIELAPLNGQAGPRPVISSAPGAAITLADGSRVSNFDIFNSGTGILANNLQSAAEIESVLISGSLTGIEIIGGIGRFTFDDVNIDNPIGVGFSINGGSSSVVYNGEITKNSGGGTVDVTNHSSGSIEFNGIINATDGSGLQFNNSDGTYTFDSTVTLNGGDAGIDILGNSNGIFRFSDMTIIDPVGQAFNVNGGSSSVTFSGDITMGNSADAIAITNHTGGEFTFENGAIVATNGSGLQFNNTDGDYRFIGSISLNGGDAGIDIQGNSGGTFTFADASIVDPVGTAFNINGGAASVNYSGNITKNNSGTLISLTNHTGGDLIFSGGVISATNGTGLQFNNVDGTYAFQGGVTLNGGDAGIDILGSSSGSFIFSDATIVNPTGVPFNINGGSASVTYNGNITKSGLGSTLAVTNHSSGSVIFQSGTLGATSGTGLQFNSADGSYAFNGVVSLNGGDAGIDIFGNSNGTFSFANTNIVSPTGTAFNVDGFGPDGQIDYFGSITGDLSDLLSIRNTTAGSAIRFTGTGSNSLSGTGGGGIFIFNADGDVRITTPTTIVDPLNSFSLDGITVSGGTGTIEFVDTSVQVTNALTGVDAGVRVSSQNGTVSFTELSISMDNPGSVGFFAASSSDIRVLGASSLTSTGGSAIDLTTLGSIDMTFDSISVTDSQAGLGTGSGIRLSGIGAGTFNATTTVIDGTFSHGIDIDDSVADSIFADVSIANIGENGVSIGSLFGNPGAVTIGGGSISGVTGDGIRVEQAGNFVMDNVQFAAITGFTASIVGSSVSGSGNAAAPFSCQAGAGNTGQILFNAGADSCGAP